MTDLPSQRDQGRELRRQLDQLWEQVKFCRDRCPPELPDGRARFPRQLHPVRNHLARADDIARSLLERYSGKHGKEYQARGNTGAICFHIRQAQEILLSVIVEMPEVSQRFYPVIGRFESCWQLAQTMRNYFDGRQVEGGRG